MERVTARTCLLALCALVSACSPARPASSSHVVVPAADLPDASTTLVASVPVFAQQARTLFQAERAMNLVREADKGFRVRGNDAYEHTLVTVEQTLRAAGFVTDVDALHDAAAPRVYSESIAKAQDVWEPVSAELRVTAPVQESLLAFDATHDVARTMLVAFTEGGNVRGSLVISLRGIGPGTVLLTDSDATNVAQEASRAGAVAVLSASAEPYNHVESHPDLIRYTTFEERGPRGVIAVNLSQRVAQRLRALRQRGGVQVSVAANVRWHTADIRMVVAHFGPALTPGSHPVVVVAHVDEPGANDNASGVASLVESAIALKSLLANDPAHPLQRPVVFLWGVEMEATNAWLRAHENTEPLVGLSLDMTGQAHNVAEMLLERMPDPGVARVRSFDAHTAWGTSDAEPREGHYLNALLETSLQRAGQSDAWVFRSHPFEGGSDHQPFLDRGIPAALYWHFPDEAYHSSLDRLDRVSVDEIARVSAATTDAVLRVSTRDDAAAAEVAQATRAWLEQRLKAELAEAAQVIARADASDKDAVTAREREAVTAWITWGAQAIETASKLAHTNSVRASIALGARDFQAKAQSLMVQALGAQP